MRCDVLADELFEVRRVGHTDLSAFFERRVWRQPIAHGAADRPERPDTNRGRAVNEHRAVRRVVRDLQELIGVGVSRIGVDDRNIEVPQPALRPQPVRPRRDVRSVAAG